MKMTLIVCNTFFIEHLTKALKDADIDYFTRWDNAKGKGHGTEPHLGTGTYASTNSVTMIAFEEEEPLEALIRGINAANKEIPRAPDRIRLFQMPLERIV